MYLSTENKKKLAIISSAIMLSTISVITGKTLASTLVLTFYPTTILPYFYLALAVVLITSIKIAASCQKRARKKFSIGFKFLFLFLLILADIALQSNDAIMPFVVSVFLLTGVTISSVISWSSAADIYDFQEYKRFSKFLQLASTLGAIICGVAIGVVSSTFKPALLLSFIFIVETLSLFLMAPLTKYVIPIQPSTSKYLNFSAALKKNSLFKYLALITIASIILATIVDYELKLELVASIEKEKIARVTSMIFVIGTVGILLIQLFLIDYLLRILGSKKIIIIYPVALLLAGLIALYDYSFMSIALLFIVNNIFTYTTSNLSRNLYITVLPQPIRNLDRLKLNGFITPIAIFLGSLVIFGISYAEDQTSLSLILVVLIAAYAIYLAKILIKKYHAQLGQSIHLRGFKRDLIHMSPGDEQEIQAYLNQALSYQDPEAKFFGLQLLANNKSLVLPGVLNHLLQDPDPNIVLEVAKILSTHRGQHQFAKEALNAFVKTTDAQTKWYLALYLVEPHSTQFLPQTTALLNEKTNESLAIVCLIYLKQGNVEQHIYAMQSFLKMIQSGNLEQMKWALRLLGEMQLTNKDDYLMQFIDEENPVLHSMALQQVGANPSNALLDFLVNHIGKYHMAYAVNASLVAIGDRAVSRIEHAFNHATTYGVKVSCISVLSLLNGPKSEFCLMDLISQSRDVVIKTIIAKYLAYRGVKIKISESLHDFLISAIREEVDLYHQLSARLLQYQQLSIKEEIISRLQFIKKRVLYYTAAIIGSKDVLNSVSLLTSYSPDKMLRAVALEVIDTSIENRQILAFVMTLFVEQKIKSVPQDTPIGDPWLTQFIQDIESNTMDSIYTLTRLRKIDLFKNLPAETLQVLAECCFSKEMVSGEVIFKEGDLGDGLYIIDSGEATVTRKGEIITQLGESAYFGELALLADISRFATVTAKTDGVLFYLDKQDFDKITDEIPEIMKSINRQVIKYLTHNTGENMVEL